MVGLDYHWRKDSFDTLRHIADLIASGPHANLYADYLKYLELRQQGRRKEALLVLDRFVRSYADDPFEIRQRVCQHLILCTEARWENWPRVDGWLFPDNIGLKLFAPMFKQWRSAEPRSVDAWLYELDWRSGLEHGSETAFMLEPQNLRCQYAELSRAIAVLDYDLHEFESVGMLLASREYYRETVKSLLAVTGAMGGNLHDDVRPLLVWLEGLMLAYDANSGDLRPALAARGLTHRPDRPISVRGWFRDPPQFGIC